MRFSEIRCASGLSDRRKGLLQLMGLARRGEITDVAVTDKDRLTRFGFGYLAQYFASHGVRLHVVGGQEDRKSLQEELVDDLLAIGSRSPPPKRPSGGCRSRTGPSPPARGRRRG